MSVTDTHPGRRSDHSGQQEWAAQPAAASVSAPMSAPMSASARALLADASRELDGALRADGPAERFAAAHLAALRAAAAVLAARARPANGRRASAWDLLARVAPELGEWAAFFAAGSPLRQAVQAGLPRAVPDRMADDMVRQSAAFLELARSAAHSGTGGERGPDRNRVPGRTGSNGAGPPRRSVRPGRRRSGAATDRHDGVAGGSRPLLTRRAVLDQSRGPDHPTGLPRSA